MDRANFKLEDAQTGQLRRVEVLYDAFGRPKDVVVHMDAESAENSDLSSLPPLPDNNLDKPGK